MAIGTFAQLKTAAANWLDRSDLTDRIPEFIALAEARFNRILRTRDMETVSTAISTVCWNKGIFLTYWICADEGVSSHD